MTTAADQTPASEAHALPLPTVQGRSLRIGRHRWAIDIAWQNRVENLQPARAKAEAIQQHYDLYVLNGAEQFGLSRTNIGHQAGMPSLALAMVEEADGQNFVGGYACGDGQFYIIAIVDRQIYPLYDNIYGEEEARSLVSDIVQTTEFHTIHAPPEWLIRNATPTPIAELLGDKSSRRYRLQTTSGRNTYILLGTLAGLSAIAFIGYTFYTDYQTRQLIRQGQLEEAARRAQEQRQARLNVPVMPPLPTITRSRGIDTLRYCTKFIDDMPHYTPGWSIETINCDGNTVSANLKQRPGGTINWLAPFIGNYKAPTLSVPMAGVATATWILDPAKIAAWGAVPGPTPIQVTRYINSQFQEAYTPFELGPPIRPEIRTKTQGQRPITVKAGWTIMSLELKQNNYLRPDILTILERIQNLTLESAEYHLATKTWTLRMQIYHADSAAENAVVAANPLPVR